MHFIFLKFACNNPYVILECLYFVCLTMSFPKDIILNPVSLPGNLLEEIRDYRPEDDISVASIECPGDPMIAASYEYHLQDNARVFNESFHGHKITNDMNLVEYPSKIPGKFNYLFASRLRYRCMNPLINRAGELLRSASDLGEFKKLCRKYSKVDDALAAKIFASIKSSSDILKYLSDFVFTVEQDIKFKVNSLMTMIGMKIV